MSAGETSAALIEYMSKRLLEVAEMNTILDNFGGIKVVPELSGPSKVGYKFTFHSVPISQDWIRVIRRKGFEPESGEPEMLATRELTALVRLRLLQEVPF